MKYKNKIYFYIAIFLLLTLVYFNFNFSTFKEGLFGLPSINTIGNTIAKPFTPSAAVSVGNTIVQPFLPPAPQAVISTAPQAVISTVPSCPPPPPPLPLPPYPTSDSMAADAAAYKAALATGLNDADSRKAGGCAGMNYLTSRHDDKNGDARIAGIAYAYAKKLGKTDDEANAAAMFAIAEMWKQEPGGFTGLNLYVNNHIEMAALTPFANSSIGTLPPSNSAILPTNYTLELNTDRNSGDTQYDIKSLTYTTPNECVRGCEAEPTCKGFVFDTRSYANNCILKSNWDGPGYSKAGLNSYKNIPRTQPPPPPPPPPLPKPSCNDILKEQMQQNKNKQDENDQAIDDEQQYMYDQAKLLSAPSIAQVNVDKGIINELQATYAALFKKKKDDKKAADNAIIFQLQKDADAAAAKSAETVASLASKIPSYKANIEMTQSQLDEIQRKADIQAAVNNKAFAGLEKYNALKKDGMNTQISQKIGEYTPEHTLEQTMRDICDNVISSIGDTTKVLTDNMGNFVGPDGLLSKFNGFTNDNTLYSSIDKIDTHTTEKENMLNKIFYTLTKYNENKNKLDASKNSVKIEPYDADTILNISKHRYCTSNYEDKLGQNLCCGLTGVLSEYNQNDQCGPGAKWCVKAPNKSHGFCSSNKPTNN